MSRDILSKSLNPIGAPNNPSFSVHRNGTSQTNITGADKIEWTTEEFDTNNDFDVATNYRFTPTVAGKYLLSCQITWGSVVVSDSLELHIYENNSVIATTPLIASGSRPAQIITKIVDANGSTDYYEIFVENITRNTSNISGIIVESFWTGCKVD